MKNSKIIDYAISHYYEMPKPIQKKMVTEGKKYIEREYPIASIFMSESTKEKCVKGYFNSKAIERANKHQSTSFWDLF